MMKNKYDVIIIGAGIGGLFAGNFLQKMGIKTLVLEKEHQVGGCCTSFERKGFTFDAGAHLFGGCGKRNMLGLFMKQIGLSVGFIQLDPTDILNFPGEKIKISSNFNEYIALLISLFPEEKDAIRSFFKELFKIN